MLLLTCRSSAWRSAPSTLASRGSCSRLPASSCGLTQTESTGVLTASGSPLRSVMLPRCATIAATREKRASPCCARNGMIDQLQIHGAADQPQRCQQQQRRTAAAGAAETSNGSALRCRRPTLRPRSRDPARCARARRPACFDRAAVDQSFMAPRSRCRANPECSCAAARSRRARRRRRSTRRSARAAADPSPRRARRDCC